MREGSMQLIYVGTIGNIEVRREAEGGAAHLTAFAGIPGAAISDPIWTAHLTLGQTEALLALLQAGLEGVPDPIVDWQKITTGLTTSRPGGEAGA